jgi:hypothetical protein
MGKGGAFKHPLITYNNNKKKKLKKKKQEKRGKRQSKTTHTNTHIRFLSSPVVKIEKRSQWYPLPVANLYH